jgi:hypothetical protein
VVKKNEVKKPLVNTFTKMMQAKEKRPNDLDEENRPHFKKIKLSAA